VIGYDTIYALQDREDDALIGLRSSALRLGAHVRSGVALFYAAALALWSVAIWWVRPEPLAFVALVPAAMQLGWQVLTLNEADPADALVKFRSNRFAGLLVFLACVTVGTGAA
jgi:4-hydroxybenzoate polyprenyltransferase